MSHYPLLFSPGQIGRLTTKNRVVMAPMVRNYGDDQGRVTPRYLAHMARIARGGVGTMILDAMHVTPNGRGFLHQVGIHGDHVVPGLRDVVAAAHAHGVKIGPQLYHAGRQTKSAVTGAPVVAPSPIPDPVMNELPRALTTGEIQDLVEAFAQAARRAKEAGFDFVEIHGAHGYLITQFLSPFTNHRDDEYGGSDENRFRFLAQIVEAVRGVVGADFPVTVRLSGDEMVPQGLTPDDTVRIARQLEAMGVAALHITAGNYASYTRGYLIQPMAIPDGPLIPFAQRVKENVGIPVIAVGKIRSPELAEEVLQTGKADFVANGRMFLADPDWPEKARAGQTETINRCIACNQGCISRLFEGKDVWCTVNPETSREEQFAAAPPTASKTVLVIGGGPGGMAAAKVARGRGHRVILCEERDHLGGQLIAAAAAPHRPGWEELRRYLMGEMDRLGVEVRLNTRATAALAQQLGAEVAIVAIGSAPIRPAITGIEHANVITARDLLEGRATATGRVIIAGGGCAGAQTAEYLAVRGHPVTIVEMMGSLAVEAPMADRELLLGRLQQLGVVFRVDTRIMSMQAGAVTVEHPGGVEDLPADTVVLCLGSTPVDGLVDELTRVVPRVVSVGDVVQPRQVTEAMVEGALAGLSC